MKPITTSIRLVLTVGVALSMLSGPSYGIDTDECLFDRQKDIRAQVSHDLDYILEFIKPDGGRSAFQVPAFEPKNTCGNNMALPDLVPTFYTPDLYPLGGDRVFFRTRKFNADDPTDAAEVADGCVGGFGKRKLMRMNLGLANLGNADVVIGDPRQNADWEYNPAHDHFHAPMYVLSLLKHSGEVAAQNKPSLAFIDGSPLWRGAGLKFFDGVYTSANQGLSINWADSYPYFLPCNYIDVTDVAPGNYTLNFTANPEQQLTSGPGRLVEECNLSNNETTLQVTVPAKTRQNYPKDLAPLLFETVVGPFFEADAARAAD